MFSRNSWRNFKKNSWWKLQNNSQGTIFEAILARIREKNENHEGARKTLGDICGDIPNKKPGETPAKI